MFEIVRIGLNQHWHVQPGEFERVGYALFVAKVGQDHQHAVELLGVTPEQFGAFARVGMRLHATELAVLLAELDGADAGALTNLRKVGTRLGDQLVREKIAVAVNDAQTWFLIGGTAHKWLMMIVDR